MNYMGIDIGTSGCKAVVFNKNGKQLAASYREYDVIFTDNGSAELNSDEVIKKCFAVISEAAAQVEPNTIKGIGISSQGEAFTAIGRDKQVLCNAMISSDIRSDYYAKTWPESFGKEKLYHITGHTAHPMFTLFKLLWLKHNRPEIWKKTEKFLCFEDLLESRLGLDPAMGWPLAGRTMLFDVQNHVWSKEILNSIGLPPEKLARPLPSGSIAGTIPQEIAQKLGLAPGAFVVTGGHDHPCGALGAGVTEPGTAMYATGTVECITPVFSKPVFTKELYENNICTYDYTVKDMYTTVAFSLTGGNILKWFRDEFGSQEISEAEKKGINAYEVLLKSASNQPSNLMVLPYFTPSGTPYFDTTTKGAILGLNLSTKRGDIIRALLEGVAFEMRLNLDILQQSNCEIQELRAIGGGAKSEFWTQLKADVLGKVIITMNAPEAGCLGVALLACSADTGQGIHELVKEWVKPLRKYIPQSGPIEFYNKRFETYRKLYPTIKAINL